MFLIHWRKERLFTRRERFKLTEDDFTRVEYADKLVPWRLVRIYLSQFCIRVQII